ncbi:MAG: hypothetical protein ABIS50_15345 [Luteolibacter sp.]|uniref:hypothetical protein n=1 Tax=Luteolibacter sp. TaxID=1962973 RepID=UPI003265A9EB
MKSPIPTGSIVSNTIEAQMIKEASAHVRDAEAALRKGCMHALHAGMRLIWLHANTSAGQGGDRKSINVPHGTLIGFEAALVEIGLSKTTAYRWMNATLVASKKLFGYETETFPTPDQHSEWKQLQDGLGEIAKGTSLRRLVIGSGTLGGEDHRQDEIIGRAESGEELAEQILERVAAGQLTWVQAIRALAGAASTKDKDRKDPVYLDFDELTRRPIGLLPKAFTTLKNGLSGWDGYDQDAKDLLLADWKEIQRGMPAEFLPVSKK